MLGETAIFHMIFFFGNIYAVQSACVQVASFELMINSHMMYRVNIKVLIIDNFIKSYAFICDQFWKHVEVILDLETIKVRYKKTAIWQQFHEIWIYVRGHTNEDFPLHSFALVVSRSHGRE